MTPAVGTYTLGPDTGALRLRTGREGVAAKVGHDLLLAIDRWSATLTVPESGLDAAEIVAEIDVDSLRVVEGTGGASALSDKDRADILKNARKVLDVGSHPTADFRSTAFRPGPEGGVIEGVLRLVGAEAPVAIEVKEIAASQWRATATVVQSEFGIKPYRAMLGALRLADPVGVEVEVKLGD